MSHVYYCYGEKENLSYEKLYNGKLKKQVMIMAGFKIIFLCWMYTDSLKDLNRESSCDNCTNSKSDTPLLAI